ncbi:breast cancer type 2 susceptibility protein homolog isoform X2 [Bombus bifarius]|uniref:Breast cancer type 2 susceptibility protein homolog isoform X2 n=1 Tax=Bombus bifarius TaxID=103933 RepID=A0A6P8MUE2_9HYME|nr:breast cancer type 2 susceptibility protein homolog isoform X2 [Bombus bifarius]
MHNKSDGFSFGFATASGNSIHVSERALSKARELFNNEFKESDNSEQKFKAENESNTFNAQIPDVGFQTASGQRINVTSEALSKAKELFNNEFKENDNSGQKFKAENEINTFNAQIPDVGFQTASGKCINVTNEALSKARELFNNELKESDNSEQKFKAENEINTFNAQIPDVGFQTASGQRINVTNEALSKAKELFNNEFKENDNSGQKFKAENEINTFNAQIPDVGFQTASGKCINVTNEALSKARELFNNELKESDNSEQKFKAENGINTFNAQIPDVGFQTASGKCVNVTNEALSKAKAMFQEEISKDFETILALPKPLQKRKIKDVDDSVSLINKAKSSQFKKLRFSNEFQVLKSTHRNSLNNEEKGNQNTSSVSMQVTLNCDVELKLKDNIMINITETSKKSDEIIDNYVISHEIASAVALLADEKDLDFTEQQISPKEIEENDETVSVPSSPVIGGQFIRKKRRSTEKQDLTDKQDQYDSAVVNDFGDSQLMIDFINQSVTVLEKRLEAALEQEKQISMKQKSKPKPTISKLYFHRKSNTNNRISWKEISKGEKPILCTDEELVNRKLPPEILDLRADNATMYKFHCADFYGQNIVQNNIDGIKLEDGACLILDENGYVGITEIKRSFLASPGVDPNLLPIGWVENHYKWIVWKLASMDRIKLGYIILPRALTPARVMMELKYRYDREIDRSQRSALRKILEKDDVATKRMVLCVSSINKCDDSDIENKNQLKISSQKLILTDGWYSIQASIDQAMMKHIISGKIKEGTKLLTYGSELLNCDQGCSPLEIAENVCLKLHTNSTRRARWDMKLGYTVPSGPMCTKLKTIYPNGGLIGKIKVIVARVYPMLYHEKTSTGESIFRNARCEEKASIIYEKECRSMIEAFYAKAEKYFHTGKCKSNLNTDSIDLAAVEWNEDCDRLFKEEFRSEQELEQLKNDCLMKQEKFRQKLESRLQENLPLPRQVTPLLKIRVIEEETNAILSVWSPSAEVIDILKEGNCISLCNVMPWAKRGNELLLTANRNTSFIQVNISDNSFRLRTYTALCEISKPTFTPAYGEFDTVGIIASIGNEPYGMKNFQAVYLAYPHADSVSSYLSILFWHGISSFGYAEILTVGSLVACGNLEWRRATSWNIPVAYCTERSIFTHNPRDSHLQEPLENLKRLITDISTYIDTCVVEISEKVQKKSMMRNNFNRDVSNENINANKQFNDHVYQEFQGRSLINNQLAKSVAIQKRLEKLQSYGEPSSLSPITLNNSSKRVSLEFQSPIQSRSGKCTKVHTALHARLTQNPT